METYSLPGGKTRTFMIAGHVLCNQTLNSSLTFLWQDSEVTSRLSGVWSVQSSFFIF